jgi:hypothetical protein
MRYPGRRLCGSMLIFVVFIFEVHQVIASHLKFMWSLITLEVLSNRKIA